MKNDISLRNLKNTLNNESYYFWYSQAEPWMLNSSLDLSVLFFFLLAQIQSVCRLTRNSMYCIGFAFSEWKSHFWVHFIAAIIETAIETAILCSS